MLADYNNIVYILHKCTTKNVRQAEKQIKQLTSQDIQVLNCLKQILIDKTNKQQIQIMGCSVLSSIFIQKMSEYEQLFIFQYWTTLLLDSGIMIKYKKLFSRLFMYVIQNCTQDTLPKWKQFTIQSLLSQQWYQIGLLMLTAFSCAEIHGNLLQEMDEKGFIFTMAMLNRKTQDMDNYQDILYIFQSWKIVVQYLVHQSQQQKRYFPIFTAISECQYFISALKYVLQQLSTGYGKHFMYLDKENPHEQQIQQMKLVSLQLLYNILNTILSHSRAFQKTLLYEYIGLHIDIFVNSLVYISHQPQYCEEYQIQQILVLMLKILKTMIRNQPEIMYSSWKQLLHFLIFPLMHVDAQEVQDFQQNTSSYIQLSQDLCQKQRMGTLKSQVANFIELISDKSHIIIKQRQLPTTQQYKNQTTIAKYIINFCIACIKHRLQMQFITANQYLALNNLPESYTIISVQAAFMILSVFSYCLDNYKKQLEDIRIILCNDRVRILPPLQRARIYTFLAYNHAQVFGSQQQLQTANYWISLALKQNSHITVSYCALDFVANSLHKVYNQQVIRSLISKITITKSMNFWSIIKKMVTLFTTKMSQQILSQFIKQSYKRIQIQIKSIKNQKMKMTFVITCLLTAIKIISQKGQYISTMPNIKLLLWDITKLYKIGVKNYFDDDLIKIINNFLFYANKQQIEHQQMHKFIPYFIEQFKKAEYEPTQYYIAFNHYISKGNYQTTVKPIYQVLKQSVKYYLFQEQDMKSQSKKKKLPIAHTLLLLENILAWHGACFQSQQLNFLHEAMKNLYPTKVQNKLMENKTRLKIYDRCLLSRALIIQFLCHIYKPNPQATHYLLKYHNLNIFYGYDVSVLLSCIKIQIFKQQQILALIQLLQIAIITIYQYCQTDAKYIIQKVNQADKRQLNEQSKIDEQQNFEKEQKKNSMMIRIKKTNDYQVILNFIHTPFLKNQKKVLGYTKCTKSLKQIKEQFIGLLDQLRNSNQALFQAILGGFSQSIKYKLQSVLECKFDQIMSGHMSNYKNQQGRRKIFKVKRVKEGFINDDQNPIIVEQHLNRRQHIQLNQQDIQQDEENDGLKSRKAQKKRREKQKQFTNQ